MDTSTPASGATPDDPRFTRVPVPDGATDGDGSTDGRTASPVVWQLPEGWAPPPGWQLGTDVQGRPVWTMVGGAPVVAPTAAVAPTPTHQLDVPATPVAPVSVDQPAAPPGPAVEDRWATPMASTASVPAMADQPAVPDWAVVPPDPAVPMTQPVADRPAPMTPAVADRPAPMTPAVADRPAPMTQPVADRPAPMTQPVADRPAPMTPAVADRPRVAMTLPDLAAGAMSPAVAPPLVATMPVMPVAAPPTAPAPVVAAPPKRRSTASKAVDGLLVVGLMVAVGGVGFAVGRQTAPASVGGGAGSAALGGFAGREGQGIRGGPGTTDDTDTTGGQTTTSGRGTTDGQGTTGQVAAPSGAPSIPDADDQGTTSQGTADQGGSTGQQGGPPQGGRGGFGLASGGTIAAVTDTGLTLTTTDGQQVEVATTADTTYHQQIAASRDDVVVGASVRVEVDGGFGGPGGFGRGQGGPGQDAMGAPPDGATTETSMTATEVELLIADASSAGQGGRGMRGGFGGGLSGTVSAIDDGSVTVETAMGSLVVTTTDATRYVRQATATRDDVTVGASVRLTTAGGRGGDTTTITASDVNVLLPTTE
ncbi:MAG: hypothetical protein KF809_13460 [Chloroflexi bacterium]|nr:hypothetical protein [Chloroflexota bacterium]